MSRVRHLLAVGCRSRSLTPTGAGGGVQSPCPPAGRRLSLHVTPQGTAKPLPTFRLSSPAPVPAPAPAPAPHRRRSSGVSPAALLFRRSPLRPDQPWNRSILPQPTLLVTPASPPDEIPDPFGGDNAPSATSIGGDTHSTAATIGGAFYNAATTTGGDIYIDPIPAVDVPIHLDEPPPVTPTFSLSVPRTPRRGSSPRVGLKFDTPERREVEEHGLDSHPEVSVLGRGAFGTVVLGKRRDQTVAVEVLRGRAPSAGELLARRLRHPHLLTVLGVYGLNTAFTVVEMEYCGRMTLQALLDGGPLTGERVARYVTQLTSALAYCHSEGVLHLDVKPANVIVSRGGDLKLGDFGSARSVDDPEARESGARGTVPYMAPELFRGHQATGRADVYALGVCTWQLLSGRRPFLSLPPETVIYAVVALRRRPEPQLSAAAGRWRGVVDKCWAQDLNDRPDAEELERWMLALDAEGNWIRDPF